MFRQQEVQGQPRLTLPAGVSTAGAVASALPTPTTSTIHNSQPVPAIMRPAVGVTTFSQTANLTSTMLPTPTLISMGNVGPAGNQCASTLSYVPSPWQQAPLLGTATQVPAQVPWQAPDNLPPPGNQVGCSLRAPQGTGTRGNTRSPCLVPVQQLQQGPQKEAQQFHPAVQQQLQQRTLGGQPMQLQSQHPHQQYQQAVQQQQRQLQQCPSPQLQVQQPPLQPQQHRPYPQQQQGLPQQRRQMPAHKGPAPSAQALPAVPSQVMRNAPLQQSSSHVPHQQPRAQGQPQTAQQRPQPRPSLHHASYPLPSQYLQSQSSNGVVQCAQVQPSQAHAVGHPSFVQASLPTLQSQAQATQAPKATCAAPSAQQPRQYPQQQQGRPQQRRHMPAHTGPAPSAQALPAAPPQVIRNRPLQQSPSHLPHQQPQLCEVPVQAVQVAVQAPPTTLQATTPATQPGVPPKHPGSQDPSQEYVPPHVPNTVPTIENVEHLNPAVVHDLLKAHNCVLVDLRGDDRDAGLIDGAIHEPAIDKSTPFTSKLPRLLEQFAKQPLVIFTCQYSAHRAPSCANLYREQANPRQRVAILRGGFRGWEACGLPVKGLATGEGAKQADEAAIALGTQFVVGHGSVVQ